MLSQVGGSINELLSLVMGPAVSRRRVESLKELGDSLEALQKTVEAFRIKDLEHNGSSLCSLLCGPGGPRFR
jgi:hypothetical protein